MMVLVVIGLFIFCLVTYLALMLVLPEWVGISKVSSEPHENLDSQSKDKSSQAGSSDEARPSGDSK